MKSSSGQHFIALDHVRAFAAYLVFLWHFNHAGGGVSVPYEYTPSIWFFPFALIDEGHGGASLYITLSGYLFAKLLDGKTFNYWTFFWNRVLRIAPLLSVVLAIVAIQRIWLEEVPANTVIHESFTNAIEGMIFPVLPNGGWTITTEFHYYAILPVFLWLLSKNRLFPIAVVAAAICLRCVLQSRIGDIKPLATWTIIGRIDQFAFGMMMYHLRAHLAGRHGLAAICFLAFGLLYWGFDDLGGFMSNDFFGSSSVIWAIFPTLEGIVYGSAIAWYDSSFSPSRSGISGFIGRVGAVSYSIYLLHFFFFEYEARFIHQHVMSVTNFYLTTLWGTIGFCLMIPVAQFSYRYIESPFLRLRRSYITGVHPGAGSNPAK